MAFEFGNEIARTIHYFFIPVVNDDVLLSCQENMI